MKKIIALLILIIPAYFVFTQTFNIADIEGELLGISRTINSIDERYEQVQQVLGESTQAFEDDPDVYQNEETGITVVLFDPSDLELVDVSNEYGAISVERLAELKQFSFAINAGFFLEDQSHAGLLSIDGEAQKDLATADPQLQNVAMFGDGILTFHSVNEIESVLGFLIGTGTLFQSGPLILDDSIVQTELIQNAPNASLANRRSILGTTADGRGFFLSTTNQRYTLNELAELIISLDFFEGTKINALNLDGGNSSTFYSSEYDSLSYREEKNIPFVLGVKRQ